MTVTAIERDGMTPEQWEMVLANTGLIGMVLRKFPHPHDVDYQDLSSAGLLGLCRAVQKFDPSRGFTFSTYAVNWIRAYVQREGQNEIGGANARRAHARGEHYSPPMSMDQARRSPHMGGGNNIHLEDVLPDTAATPEVLANAAADGTDLILAMRRQCRDEVDHVIVDLLAYDARTTLAEMAEATGLTSEGARQRKLRLAARLRHPCTPWRAA